jgi:hypothetical protein
MAISALPHGCSAEPSYIGFFGRFCQCKLRIDVAALPGEAGPDSDIIRTMSGKQRKKEKRPVFDSIRKPTAPPSQSMGKDKPDEKAYPSRRNVKHKGKLDPQS